MSRRNRQARDVSAAAPKEAELMRNEELAAKDEVAPATPAEQAAAPAAPVAAPKVAEPKLDFDAWFSMRGAKIPAHHHKEIIKADFKRRGLGQCESLKDFDAALKKYGLNLA